MYIVTDYELELQVIDIDLQIEEIAGLIKSDEEFWEKFKKVAEERGIPKEYIDNYVPKEFNNPYSKKPKARVSF